MSKVGLIGLGRMGLPIAKSLIAAGHTVVVHAREANRARNALPGCDITPSPALAVTPGGVVFTVLPDDDAVAEVSLGPEGILMALGKGVHVSLSTISPDTARALAERHAEHGAQFVAAPVFGRPEAAEAKKLLVVCAGHRAGRERVRPLLEAIGRTVIDLGGDPGAACAVKLSGNLVFGALVAGMSEAFALASASGVDAGVFGEVLRELAPGSPIAGYADVIAEGKYEPPGFTAELARKDLRLVAALADAAGVPLPVGHAVLDRVTRLVASGDGKIDWSAIARQARRDAGLPDVGTRDPNAPAE